jgi:hypothetical protein
MIDRDAIERGDTVTYLAPSGKSECTAEVEYIVTAELRRYPVHWHRVTGHTPKARPAAAPEAALTQLLRDAAGIAPEQWEVLDASDREYVLMRGRRALVRAARVSAAAWGALPRRSPECAAVLLRGARVLHIETDWAGWAGSNG